jgi:pilus assembly protein CpaB
MGRNRIGLIFGAVLVVAVFVGVIMLMGNGQGSSGAGNVTVVVATVDVPAGTSLTPEMVTTKQVGAVGAPVDAFSDPSAVVGRTVRANVANGAVLTQSDSFRSTSSGVEQDVTPLLATGMRGMAVQVDQVSGVGTLIHVGDHVDAVIGITGTDKFPTVIKDPVSGANTVQTGMNSTSVKVLVQNLEVIGSLLPPPVAADTSSGSTKSANGTSLNGQQEIVILAVTPQQAEVLKFAQIDGLITLVLRSTADKAAPADVTSGIVLKTLIDKYGVLPPQVVIGH